MPKTPKRKVGGNTITPTRGRRYAFTLNNWTQAEYDALLVCFEGMEYIIGKEVGANGTPHLQGYVEFPNKKEMSALKKVSARAHWEPAKGNKEQNLTYCSKGGDVLNKLKMPGKIKVLEDEKLFMWQQVIMGRLEEEPDDRKIYWYVDEIGGKGKTTFAKKLCVEKGALYISGKAADIKYAVSEGIKDPAKPPVMIFDFTRSLENYVSYEGIESVKNGIMFSGKYESKQIVFNCPHIIVFSNFQPDQTKLSADRWVIIDLNEPS